MNLIFPEKYLFLYMHNKLFGYEIIINVAKLEIYNLIC